MATNVNTITAFSRDSHLNMCICTRIHFSESSLSLSLCPSRRWDVGKEVCFRPFFFHFWISFGMETKPPRLQSVPCEGGYDFNASLLSAHCALWRLGVDSDSTQIHTEYSWIFDFGELWGAVNAFDDFVEVNSATPMTLSKYTCVARQLNLFTSHLAQHETDFAAFSPSRSLTRCPPQISVKHTQSLLLSFRLMHSTVMVTLNVRPNISRSPNPHSRAHARIHTQTHTDCSFI